MMQPERHRDAAAASIPCSWLRPHQSKSPRGIGTSRLLVADTPGTARPAGRCASAVSSHKT